MPLFFAMPMFSPVLVSKKDVRLDRSSLFVLQQSDDNVVVRALQQPLYGGREEGQTKAVSSASDAEG